MYENKLIAKGLNFIYTKHISQDYKPYVFVNNSIVDMETYNRKTYIMDSKKLVFNIIVLFNFITGEGTFYPLEEYINNSELINNTLNVYLDKKLKFRGSTYYYQSGFSTKVGIYSSVIAVYTDELTEKTYYITKSTKPEKIVMTYEELLTYDKSIDKHLEKDMQWLPKIDKETVAKIVAKRSE